MSSSKKTNFQLVNLVLDELTQDVKKIHGDQSTDVIKAQLTGLSNQYAQLSNAKLPAVDYASPEARFAYVFTYVATHADYVYQLLRLVEKHLSVSFLNQSRVVVTCLGGGPGSELVGLMQYLDEASPKQLKTVTAYLCDREQAWADCWTEIGEEIEASFNLHVNFQSLDVTAKESWSKQKKFLSADLFLCSYFASEVARFGAASDAFWSEIGSEAKSGALMLIIDNDHTFFEQYVSQSVIRDAWEIVETCATALTPSFREQKTDLGEHLKKFERSPKLKGRVKFWLLRKQ